MLWFHVFDVLAHTFVDETQRKREREGGAVRGCGRAARHALTPLALVVGLLGCSGSDSHVDSTSPKGDASTDAHAEANADAAGTQVDAGTQVQDAGSTTDAAPRDAGTAGTDAHATADSGSSSHPDSGGPPPPPSCNPTPSQGANVPYQEYEAENATTNGTVIGPSRAVNDPNVFNSIAGESSGREAVKLSGTGQYVQFATSCVSSSIVVRYVIPDSSDGSGSSATLGLYVNGSRIDSLALTSVYSWAYGNPETTDATTNNPGDGYARHFYDEVRFQLPSEIPSGTTVKLQQDSQDTASYYVIDLVDFEEVPAALAQPSPSVSIAMYGATPNDGTDDGAAIMMAIQQAEYLGRPVWIPPGTYLNAGTQLVAANVKIQGAGMWQSTIQGAAANFICSSGSCQFSDFSVYGDVTLRNDDDSIHAFSGPFGGNSSITNVWMEHFTTGPWIGQPKSAAIDGMVIQGCRIRDLYADGVNLNNGTSNSTVEQCEARNTGDDAFVSWASLPGTPNPNNVFKYDTVQIVWRSTCFAIYGGSNETVTDSVCADTVTYPGIFIYAGFSSDPFGGTISIANNSILRGGGAMYGTSWGAMTVDGDQMGGGGQQMISGIQIENLSIQSATFSGVLFIGSSDMDPNDPVSEGVLSNLTIASPGTYGIQIAPSASGIITATDVVVTSPGSGGLSNSASSVFTIGNGGGNTGWTP